MTQDSPLLRFADVEFDVRAGELRRAGVTTRLEPQPARVLALLVERAGEVVTRAELQQRVWSGDTFVDFERGLNYCVAQIRTALGDSASTPRFIETLPRRGYRFIAPVAVGSEPPAEPIAPASATGAATSAASATSVAADLRVMPHSAPGAGPARSRPFRPAVAVAIGVITLAIVGAVVAWMIVTPPAVAARPVRIAVALFDNETDRPGYDRLAQTLTDATVARLASDPARVTVIGNAPILRQARSFRDVTTIAAALGTEHVILGQVQEIAGRLRVTTHLIRASDQGHVWARRFEPTEGELATLDRTVADAVAGAVAAKLLGE